MEFQRRARPLSDIRYWKASELQQFILYTGPFVLFNNVPENTYNLFIVLHTAIRILSSKELVHYSNMIQYANRLLKNFAKNFLIVYGDEYCCYNVHSLLHLSDDVSNNGPLDSFSAFCFENLYGIINRKIQCNGNQLTQLHNRLDEFYRSCSFNEHEIPLYHVDNNFTTKSLKHVSLLNYKTRVNDKDTYILLKDGVFCKVISICTTQNVLIFKVHR